MQRELESKIYELKEKRNAFILYTALYTLALFCFWLAFEAIGIKQAFSSAFVIGMLFYVMFKRIVTDESMTLSITEIFLALTGKEVLAIVTGQDSAAVIVFIVLKLKELGQVLYLERRIYLMRTKLL